MDVKCRRHATVQIPVSGLQNTNHLSKQSDTFINHHPFFRGMFGAIFKFVPCLDPTNLLKGSERVVLPRYKCAKRQKIAIYPEVTSI